MRMDGQTGTWMYGQMDIRACGQRDMTKLIAGFRNFAKRSKRRKAEKGSQSFMSK